MSAPTKNKRIG